MKTEVENNKPLDRFANKLKPRIRPEIFQVGNGDLPLKIFYAQMREAREKGVKVLDVGSSENVGDAEIPLVTQVIDEAHEESKRRELHLNYGSSWGMMDLRSAITHYFADWGGVYLDPKTETMVSRGTMDGYDRVLRAFDWKGVIVPDWAPFFPRWKATINRLPIIDAPTDLNTGNLRLDVLEQGFQEQGMDPGGLLIYIAHPTVPIGSIMEDSFIEGQLIPFCRNKGIFLFSDSYIRATELVGRRLRPILSYDGAKDVCVEAITVAKELGLPGARAGGIAGNRHIINGIRLLASKEVDIVSGPSQILAARALEQIRPETVGQRIRYELEKEISPRFKEMNWPFLKPEAGTNLVVAVPPGFIRDDIEDPSSLAAVAILRRYGIGICPCSVFGKDGKYALRMILKQKEGEIARALDTMRNEGFCWQTEKPTAEDVTFLNGELTRLDLTRL